jgi:uncharacterized protein YhbP (UPF0306 family)
MKRVLSILAAVFLTSNTFGQATHYVGESYGDGIVFYVYDDGKHGIITATMDRSKRIQRQNETSTVTNTVTNGIDAVKFNTERISAIKGAEEEVQIYSSYQDSYYSDWYLPSKYELSLLYLNRAVLGGYADFSKGWSTTEASRVNAWFKSFATGGSFTNGKDDVVYVRDHRRF